MDHINTLGDIQKHARVCLFGAGDFGISLFHMMQEERPDIDIVCFVDSYKTERTCGLDTVQPEDLVSLGFDFIIITSHHFETNIAQNLERLGISNYVGLNPIFGSKYSDPEYFETAPRCDDNTLYAFYDFAVSPYGFDYVLFLYLAEIERQKLGCDKIQPIIVPNPDDTLIHEGKQFKEGMSGRIKFGHKHNWWCHHIIVPSTWLSPHCNQITICNTRDEAWGVFKDAKHIYPTSYRPHHPVQGYSDSLVVNAFANTKNMPSLTATPMAFDYIDQWIDEYVGGRKLVVITLREVAWALHQRKNSNLEAWTAFSDRLDRDVYFPVYVRDTTAALGPIPDALKNETIFAEAPWNMEIRMALYQRAYACLFVGNGPGILTLLNRDTRVLIFMRADQGNVAAHVQFENAGVKPGEAYPNLTDLQRIVFVEDDDADVIEREFATLCQNIEMHEQ